MSINNPKLKIKIILYLPHLTTTPQYRIPQQQLNHLLPTTIYLTIHLRNLTQILQTPQRIRTQIITHIHLILITQ